MNLKLAAIASLFICVRDGRPDSLLVATDSRIARLRLVDDADADTETLHGQPASSVRSRRDASTRELYFVTNDTVYYSYYSGYTGTRSDAMALTRLSSPSSDGAVRRLAVDWASPRLHVARGRRLFAAAMLGGHGEHEIDLDHEIEDMAVDPYERVMFVSAGGQVYSYALGSYDSAVRLESVTSRAEDFSGVRLAVDHHRRRLFALVVASSGTSRLLVSNYDGSDTQLVYEGGLLEGGRALDQHGGRLAWARCLESTGGCQLYSCAPDNDTRCYDVDVSLLWNTSEVVNDLIFRSAKRHSPPAELACRELRCSHSCDSSDPYSVLCSCPPGLELDTRTNTCQEPVDALSAWLSRSVAWLRGEADRLVGPALALSTAAGVTLAVSLACVCLCLAAGAGRRPAGDYDGDGDRECHGMRETTRPRTHGKATRRHYL